MQSKFDIDGVDRIVGEIGRKEDCLIPILQAIQKRYRYLPEEALLRVCEATDCTPAAVEGVASFYAQFRRKPVGQHVISVCDGTACHVKGSAEIFESIKRE